MEYLNNNGTYNQKNVTPWEVAASDSFVEDSYSESNHYEEQKNNKAKKRY